MDGVTFGPTTRQLATAIIVAGLPMAGGVYALVECEWYSFGGVWTGIGGLSLVLALSAITDRTRLDTDGVSVRRFLVYRFSVRWAEVAAVEEATPPPHRRGRAIVVSTLIGQSIALPAPVHLPALPDPRFSAKAGSLAAFARSAAAEDRRAAPRPKYDTVHTESRHARSWVAASGIPQAILAIAGLVGVAGSLNSLHDNVRNAANFNAAPRCAVAQFPMPDSTDPWCVADTMTVDGLLSNENEGPFGFAISKEQTGALPVFIVLGPHAPILDRVTANDVVRDVVVNGDRVGAFTYDGQRFQTEDSPVPNVALSVESLDAASSLAVLCSWLFFLRSGKPRRVAVQTGLIGVFSFMFVSIWLASWSIDGNPGIVALPFFALAIGSVRLVWIDYPFVRPRSADQRGGLLWARDDPRRTPGPDDRLKAGPGAARTAHNQAPTRVP